MFGLPEQLVFLEGESGCEQAGLASRMLMNSLNAKKLGWVKGSRWLPGLEGCADLRLPRTKGLGHVSKAFFMTSSQAQLGISVEAMFTHHPGISLGHQGGLLVPLLPHCSPSLPSWPLLPSLLLPPFFPTFSPR